MPGALLSVIGFKPDLVLRPAVHYDVSEVHLLASDHPEVRSALETVRQGLRQAEIHVTVEGVDRAFDIVAWYLAWQRVHRKTVSPPMVNLTAGHGAAISAGCLLAIEHGLPTCLFDQETGDIHGFSPRILLHLGDLSSTDRRILNHLIQGEASVGAIADDLALEMSTASRALERLREKGFCGDRREGRTKINYLAAGVADFLRKQHGGTA